MTALLRGQDLGATRAWGAATAVAKVRGMVPGQVDSAQARALVAAARVERRD